MNNGKETKFFNTTFIHPAAYYDQLQMTIKIKERRAAIDDHNRFKMLRNAKTTQPSRNSKNEKKDLKQEVSKEKKPKFKEQEAQTKLVSITRTDPPNKRLTIPRVKAMCASKHNERNFHTVPSVRNLNHYEHQKRLKEVLHQKTVLENMLAEHKQLKRDRENIVNEIHMMRGHLDSIRNRLNSSLRKLNDKFPKNDSHLSDSRALKNKFYSRVNYFGKTE